jgi:hypothetical protein
MSGNEQKKHQPGPYSEGIRTLQDTIQSVIPQDSTVIQSGQDSIQKSIDSLSIRQFTPENIQSLFERSNRHQEALDSLSRQPQATAFQVIQEVKPEPFALLDSNHILFSVDSFHSLPLPEFELDLPRYSYREEGKSVPVFIEDRGERTDSGKSGKKTTWVQKDVEKGLAEKEKLTVSNDWFLGVFLTSFILLAWIRLFYNKFLSPTFTAVINQQVSYNLFRDRSSVSSRVALGLNFIFYLNAGLYLYLVLSHLEIDFGRLGGFIAYLVLISLIVALYAAKSVVFYLVGIISLTQKPFAEYTHTVFLFNRNLGLALFPVVLGIVYISDSVLPVFLYTGMILILVGYLLRLFRGFQIFIKEGVSILYWILYLCALEFLPILLFLKLSGLLV